MTAWMLLYIGDLCVRKSEWVVDRLKSLHVMQVWWVFDLGTRLNIFLKGYPLEAKTPPKN